MATQENRSLGDKMVTAEGEIFAGALDRAAAPPHGPTRRRSSGRWFRETGWRHIVGVVMLVFSIFPILFAISASLNPVGTLTGTNALFSRIGFESYARILTSPGIPYTAWFANTIVIATITSVATVFLGALAAYSFSRMRFTGRRAGLITIVVVQMFPQMLAVVAIFLVLSTIGDYFPALGLDTRLGLIMVYLGGALGVNTFLMYGFFNTIPVSIDEAAKIDGAGHARIFFTMILRLVTPILIVVFLLSFIASFNDYVIASALLIQPENQTLAVGLIKLVSNPRYADWPAFCAGAIMAAVPVIIVFLFAQKWIVGGLTSGSVK